MESKGILIIAAGHAYYGRMAHNLAVSLKHSDPSISIALVWAGNALDHLTLYNLSYYFDHIIEAPADAYTREGKTEWIRAKTFIYDLSPFDETLYLDADTLWLPEHKPQELFEQLKDVDFTIQNTSSHIEWVNINHIREAYNLPDEKYVPVSSEFIYFKKTDAIQLFFERVKHNYDTVESVLSKKFGGNKIPVLKKFAGGIPDELPLLISMMQLSVYPHSIPFVPMYWQTKEKRLPELSELHTKYFLLSCGGKFVGEWTKKHYDRLVQHYFHKANLRYIWKLQNKRSFLPERITL